MKINIGSGTTRYNGFLNCDYDKNCNPDFAFDLEKEIWPFKDNSVEEIIAHHILEHMGEGYFHAIKEIYRICKHGAIVDIRVPHHNHENFINDPTHRRPITAGGMWLFSKKYNDSASEQNAMASRLAYYYDVNFEVLDVTEIPSKKYIELFEGKPIEDVEQYMREHNNIIEEVNIKLIAIKDD